MAKRIRKSKPEPPLAPLDRNQRYNVEEGLRYLRMCRATMYKCVGDGSLKIIKHRGRTFLSGEEIARVSGARQS